MNNVKVLIVDDEECIGKILRDGLQSLGYETTYVATLESAEEIIDKSATMDAVLIDLHLSDTRDGCDICKSLSRDKVKHLIIMSGDTPALPDAKARALGVLDKSIKVSTIEKPFGLIELADILA